MVEGQCCYLLPEGRSQKALTLVNIVIAYEQGQKKIGPENWSSGFLTMQRILTFYQQKITVYLLMYM